MKKQWYTYLIIIVLLLCVGVFIPIFINLTNPAPALTQISNNPQRIVSLAPNLTEILFALGLGEKIVAVSNDSDYPPETAGIKKIGTFWQPSTEAIIAAKPDLVITLWFEQQKNVADTLRRLGYDVLTLKVETVEELSKAIQKIGVATGRSQRADELVKSIDSQLKDLQSKLISTVKVKALWVVQPEPMRVAGRNTFINELLELAGGQNAVGPTISQYPQIGTEQLLVCSADVIIQAAMSTHNIPEQQQAANTYWSKYPQLPAVKNNRIYVIESDTILRLGPRLPQGIELIAGCLHPDVFTNNSDIEQHTK